MTATLTTRNAKDSSGTPFPLVFADQSGINVGPLAATHAILNASAKLINPATDETVASIGTTLGTAIGTDGTAPPSFDGGATGVRGWLRQIWSVLTTGTLKVQAMIGESAVTSLNPLPVALAADSVVLTLPSGLAQDASLGLLGAEIQALQASIGSPTDAAWTGAGPGTLISVMKAVALAGGTTTPNPSPASGQANFNNPTSSGLAAAVVV